MDQSQLLILWAGIGTLTYCEQEEEIEEPHVSPHRKILTSSRLVHSIDSTFDPDNYDEITHLNKNGCCQTLVDHLGPKSNKATE